MRGLVNPAFAADLLQQALELGQEAGKELPDPQLARRGEEPFRSFMFSERMAENATRLVNRKRLKGVDVPMRYRMDFMIKKAANQPDMKNNNPNRPTAGYHPEYGTGYHQVSPRPVIRTEPIPDSKTLAAPAQDSSEHGSDRAGELQFWMALKEVTPDMGP